MALACVLPSLVGLVAAHGEGGGEVGSSLLVECPQREGVRLAFGNSLILIVLHL